MTSVHYEQSGRVVTLTLNRPDTLNALSADVVDALIDGLEKANADKAVSCVVIAGAGKGFSSGGNLHELRALTTTHKMGLPEVEEWYRTGIQRIPTTFHLLDVVTIAAVHGHAIGAGCDLAAMCDLRIAATNASFAESFVRVGLISGDGGAWFLPRAIGLTRAKEMMLTAQPVDAAKALDWGLVSMVVEQDQLMETALQMASQIAVLPPNAVRASKELLRAVETASLEESLKITAKFQARLQLQPDHLEAVDSILGKRPPRFTGSLSYADLEPGAPNPGGGP
jgi:enoyl-CoA hydratase/carnithine racemase